VSLTKKDVDLIQALLDDSQFDRLSLELEGMKLELARSGAAPKKAAPAPPPQPTLIPTPGRTARAPQEGLTEVLSPLLGVFYRAPKPGEPPFVEVGSRVEEHTIIGIIEVMKLMNSARAGVKGEVVEILAVNGEMVEHGEALMLVRPD
jgi:acetyl-CoA carboxylase biotin carboxyl carrier protein